MDQRIKIVGQLPYMFVDLEKIEEVKGWSRERVDWVKERILEEGFTTPIHIKRGHADIFIRVDGKHRIQACKELGFPYIPCKLDNL